MSVVVSEACPTIERTVGFSGPATGLRYVSGKRADALRRLGLTRVRDVLMHLPHRYLDFTNVVKIGFADVGQDATVVGQVMGVRLKTPKPRMQIVEVDVADETGMIQASFFRQPWIKDTVHEGDFVALSGKVTFAYGFRRMQGPFYEVLGSGADATASYARVLPVHRVTEGITASWMRRIVSAAVEDAAGVIDPVPTELVARLGLMSLARALRAVHFPASLAEAEDARRRLAFDELLCLQLTLMCRQRLELKDVTPVRHVTDGPARARLEAALPFTLTDEQRQATEEILADMAAPAVMNRLLLGDVGTGKTAVALVAMASCADTGSQAALMAPTSVLARQYAEKMGGLLDAAGISWALVTGTTPAAERSRLSAAIAAGEITCIFGTTALLSEDVRFSRLSLVVIDEQHRFGVNERLALRQKGEGADLLTMTATPIPRTLALSVYGDLACSRIRHRPHPGAGVTTKVIPPENIDIAYGAIRDAVAKGQRAYVICPLVDDADDGAALDDVPESKRSAGTHLHAATTTAKDLSRGPLRGCSVGVVTGRMGAAEKAEAMDGFRCGEIDVLCATTVVEVGVDVPEATVMVVFDADRFGLATLHQLRGRVGRGELAGTVYMVCPAKRNTPARERLSALEATSDGFELAELDLKLRREGEVLGYRQHGGVTLTICDLSSDADLVEAAHADARAIAERDPALEESAHRMLAVECMERFGAYFEEMERI